MVKNEADIIELFVRINARHVDHLFILDHQSQDATADIIHALTKEGFPITYRHWNVRGHAQSESMTQLAREVSGQGSFEYLIALDADEFILVPQEGKKLLDVLRDWVAPDGYGELPWHTYCPMPDAQDFFSTEAPLFHNFRRREIEPVQFCKVVLGNEFARHCIVGSGNHTARNPKLKRIPAKPPLMIQHVPIRGQQQLISKAIIGSHNLAMNARRTKGEGFHWAEMAGIIRTRRFEVDRQLLTDIAIRYACRSDSKEPNELAEGGFRIGSPTDRIEYKSLAQSNLTAMLDAYISEIILHYERRSWRERLSDLMRRARQAGSR